MNKVIYIIIAFVLLSSCSGSGGQFTGWQTEEFAPTAVTESTTKNFIIGNTSDDKEQHIRAIAFDRGSNAAGHFRIDKLKVDDRTVSPNDIVVPPGGTLTVTVTYAPQTLEITKASYGGWVTGESERWIPRREEDVGKEESEPIYQRSIIETVYDYPREGILYVHLVGEAKIGPNGEEAAGGAFAKCTPGDGVACYSGGFALDIPKLAPGGPKSLEMTGPIKMNVNDGTATMRMDDFPLVLYVLRSSDIPQLPSGVTATLVLSGGKGVEAAGTFDGSRLSIKDITFRIRVALGELTLEQVKQGMSALVDFEIPNLEITTIKPFDHGAITLHLDTKLPQNPSGNELFDQFLSGAQVIAILEGELAF